MKKFSKEYAEELAKQIYQPDPSSISEFAKDLAEPKRKAAVKFYMKAIEETNANELLEACVKGFELCDKLRFPTEQELNELKEVFKHAINKASK